ncbi:hypothetical protein ACLB2K_051255 [Fragaria x ananassa]
MANLLYNDSLSLEGPDQPQGQEIIPFQSETPTLLHGSLAIRVKEAKNLPDKLSFRKYVARAIAMLPGMRRQNIISSPYVTISISDAVVGRTFVTSFVGISAQKLCSDIKVEGAFPILETTSGKSCMPGAVLSLSMQYTSIEKLAFHNRGVGSDPDHQGVPGTYFPLRKGGKVTLYQDAHVPDGCLPNFELDGFFFFLMRNQ